MRIGITLSLFLLLLLLLLTPTISASEDVLITKDAFVRQGNGYSNMGTDNFLNIGDYNFYGAVSIQSFLASDTLNKNKYKWYYNISAANLRLFEYGIGNPSVESVDIYRVSADWSETVIKYENQPAYSVLITSYAVPIRYSSAWFNVDITNEIVGVFNGTYTNYGYVFVDPVIVDNVHQTLLAREYAGFGPFIQLTYTYKNLTNPTNVTILSPGNGTRETGPFNWSVSSAAAESELSITYQFQVSNLSDFSTTIINTNTSNNFSNDISSYLQANTTYYARVRPYDSVNYGNWSSIIQIDRNNYNLESLTPLNGSSVSSSTPIVFTWREWVPDTPYTLYISTDNDYINIISTTTISGGIYEDFTTTISSLTPGTKYYWKVKNASGYFTNSMNFTVNSTPPIPGRLNITAVDEQTGIRITIFNSTLYNATTVISKSTTTGWTNYSSAEVAAGEYLVRITALNYSSRNVLATSPDNVTVYLPNSYNATVNLIAFYLVDTTGKFPGDGSKITITKNGSVMVSSYFDADQKAVASLINGDPYGISISYQSNVQNWGNYIPVSSGNVQIFLTQIGINSTETRPFIYNITYSSSTATLAWTDTGGVMNSLNYTIYKGSGMTLGHQLITSVKYGQSTYIITAPDIYYIYFTASTTDGERRQIFAFETRTTVDLTAKGKGNVWTRGTFAASQWIYDVIAILFIILFAGGFGAIYAELGGLITIISTLYLYTQHIISATGAGIGFMGGLGVVIVLAYMKARDSGQVAMMAYKAAMFLIFFNFAILIINTSGIIPGSYVDIYGNNCQGSNTNTAGCILARISSVAPQESTENSTSVLQQIGLILVSATAFGLIILTLQYMLALFWFSIGISAIYLSQLPISWEWKLALNVGALIIYVTGFMQYKAATSLKDKE